MGEFRNTVMKVEHLLRGGGIGVRQLGNFEIKNLLNRYLNFGNPRILNDLVFEGDRIKIGEAWKAVSSKAMAGFLLYLYKTVRYH